MHLGVRSGASDFERRPCARRDNQTDCDPGAHAQVLVEEERTHQRGYHWLDREDDSEDVGRQPA